MSTENKWEQVFACPYCFSGVREEWPYCCGENHAEWMYQDEDGEVLTAEEYNALETKYDKQIHAEMAMELRNED